MKRDIKFRVWDADNSDGPTMHYTDNLTVYENCVVADYDFKPPYYNCNDDTHPLMQFTGLFDNQGKEIYEGDLLAVDWADQRYPPHTIGPVEWDEDNACWYLGEGGSPKQDTQSHMEVIGDIYSTPELLNKN